MEFLDTDLSIKSSRIRGVVQINDGVFDDLQPLSLEKCSFFYTSVILNAHGKIRPMSDRQITILDQLDVGKPVEFSFKIKGLQNLLAAKIRCELKNSFRVESPFSLLTTFSDTPIPAPTDLKAFFGTRIYGLAEVIF